MQLAAHEARACGGAAALEKGKGKAGITASPFYTELQAEVRVQLCLTCSNENDDTQQSVLYTAHSSDASVLMLDYTYKGCQLCAHVAQKLPCNGTLATLLYA